MVVVPQDSQNKDELFQFIRQELQRITVNSQYHLLTTKADIVLSIKPTDTSDLPPCQQEEADTRMMLHLRHVVDQVGTKVSLRTVDSDVVVLALGALHWIRLRKKTYRDPQLGCWDCNVVNLCPASMLFLQVVTLCPRWE